MRARIVAVRGAGRRGGALGGSGVKPQTSDSKGSSRPGRARRASAGSARARPRPRAASICSCW